MKMYDCDGELTTYLDEAMYLYFENKDDITLFIHNDCSEDLEKYGSYLIQELKESIGGWFFFTTNGMGKEIYRQVPEELVRLIKKN